MPSLPPTLKKGLENYLPNVLLIWLFIFLYRTSKYYSEFLKAETQSTLLILALAYTAYGFFRLFVYPVVSGESKGKAVFFGVKKIAGNFLRYAERFSEDAPKRSLPKITPEERTAILFALVKAFFLPIMLNFLFSNFRVSMNFWNSWVEQGFPVNVPMFNMIIFPLVFNVLFLIDTAFFTFGYSVESGSLKNKVRSVEPTPFGWFVALLCYPPFNGFFGTYVDWYANDFSAFPSEVLTAAMRVLFLVLIGIYVWATLALGAKCSNLTNRGIVDKGPYAFVRHPAYISKNLAWWVTSLPILSTAGIVLGAKIILSLSVWTFVYFLRAITEERHLMADPDYVKYAKKVRHRFIPGIF